MENGSPVGTGTLLPGTEPVNEKNQPADVHERARQMSKEFRLEILAGAVESTLGLLFLMAVTLESRDAAAALVATELTRATVAALLREMACQLNGALDDYQV